MLFFIFVIIGAFDCFLNGLNEISIEGSLGFFRIVPVISGSFLFSVELGFPHFVKKFVIIGEISE